MEITLYSRDSGFLTKLFDGQLPEVGSISEPVSGVTLSYRGSRREHGLIETLELINLTVSFSTGVAASLFANWLWSKMPPSRGKPKIIINRTVVEVEDKGTLLRIVQEQLSRDS